MNKLIISQVGFMNHLMMYIDFTNKDSVEVEVKGFRALNGDIDKKYTLDKKLSRKVFNALEDCDIYLERDYQGDTYIMDGVETNVFMMRDCNVVLSHWNSFCWPEYEDYKELFDAVILACPEVKDILVGGEEE